MDTKTDKMNSNKITTQSETKYECVYLSLEQKQYCFLLTWLSSHYTHTLTHVTCGLFMHGKMCKQFTQCRNEYYGQPDERRLLSSYSLCLLSFSFTGRQFFRRKQNTRNAEYMTPQVVAMNQYGVRTVSIRNKCTYCFDMHMALHRAIGHTVDESIFK